MRRPGRNHPSQFKAKLALAATRSERALAELAEQFDAHPNNVSQWKCTDGLQQAGVGDEERPDHHVYGPERARYRQDYTEGGESITRFYVGGVFEAVHRNNTTGYRHHIVAAGEMVATHIRRTEVDRWVWPKQIALGFRCRSVFACRSSRGGAPHGWMIQILGIQGLHIEHLYQ